MIIRYVQIQVCFSKPAFEPVIRLSSMIDAAIGSLYYAHAQLRNIAD